MSSTVPQILSDYDWSDLSPMLAKLQVLAEKADQTAKAVSMDMKNRYHVTQREPLDTDSDSDSDSTSLLSEVAFEDIIDEMSVYMENLLSLATSLEHAAEDNVHVEPSPILVDDLTSVVEPARPFIIIIKDRFPSIDFPLARKLGETNWLRRERLWEKLTAVAEGDAAPTLNDALSRGDTVTDIHPSSHSDQRPTDSIMSGVTRPSVHQSVTTASGFTEPSLFDTSSHLPHGARPDRVAESVTSFATSMADGLGHGQRRIPRPPENHDFQGPFRCQICGIILTDIHNLADWK
jgi:hypothetical protein